MDSVNRQTARERPDLLEWRKCQGQAGLNAVLAIVLCGSLTYVPLSFVPRFPKKYIPLCSLGAGAVCGWIVSRRSMMSCQRDLEGSMYENADQPLEVQSNTISLQETKFGDKEFFKE